MAIKAVLEADPRLLRCVLAGSASLGLSDLDGSGPLKRRSARSIPWAIAVPPWREAS